ncbi:SIMPL domain-containing protein [Sulfitobacter sp. R18_1]|uniref:SIMPL domain-containing protein n=1 Tax=Sulfitobacter sp. R18_1 TaxID=2821104 RepID=UPI001ADB00CD|nr:SIMPL domain-containing protein [Sulfitobacter sp. R18_1]MBO9431163.1 SIMPL domain-containing protein [Sulfitobacter sp. R18_1]
MRLMNWVAMAWMAGAGLVSAQQGPEEGIIVTGQGSIAAAPDMATITLGVTEEAETAKAAMDGVNAAVSAILTQLDAQGVAAKDRQTSRFYLRPVHDRRANESGQPPRITGYQAGNSVTVKVRDLDRLGAMMDAVIDEGANDFNGLDFGLQDPKDALAEARKAAVADATERARQLAEAAGVKLGTLIRMTENSHAQPKMFESARMGMAMDSAVAEGEVEVQAQVSMTFAIAPGQ